MNDALKLLRKILRPFGYDIKQRYAYNLLPLKNPEQAQQPLVLNNERIIDQKKDTRKFNKLFICVRTCLRETNQKEKAPNVAGVSHYDLVLHCLTSVTHAVNYLLKEHPDQDTELVLFDDHSDQPYKERISGVCEKLVCPWEFRTTGEYGQGASLIEQFEFAKSKEGLFYFCEDDYLHSPTAVSEMLQFYRQIFNACNTHLVIHPQEHEFLYIKTVYPSYLLLGSRRHWRTISHATHVLFTHTSVVTEYWQYFENTRHVGDRKNRKLGSEKNTTNHLFKHIPGFAPIPALAAHMQTENCLPPFFDWRELWDKSKPD